MTATAPGQEPYRLYYLDISYFSGKLQAYLRYKQIPLEEVAVDWWTMADVILPNTGLMKVPVVRTPDGQWLQDSTPMIDWFEERFPAGAVLPGDPYQAFFCRLLEDYADEWMWRPALHYRWSYDNDSRLYANRFLQDFIHHPPGTRWLTRQYLVLRQRQCYVSGDGVTPATRAMVEAVYTDTLGRLQQILERQPFLLGERPTLADFGFFASMFRHFSIDPTPARIMRDRAPAVYEWVARMWNARRERLQHLPLAAPGTLPEGWSAILLDIGRSYLPYLLENARAVQAGRARFDLTLPAGQLRNLPRVVYRAWCRERLQDHYEALPGPAQAEVRETLELHGCFTPLFQDGRLPSGLFTDRTPPLCRPRETTLWEKVLWYWKGTAWSAPPR